MLKEDAVAAVAAARATTCKKSDKKKDKPWWEKAVKVGKKEYTEIKEKIKEEAAPVLDKIKGLALELLN